MALDKACFKSIACNANRSAIIREGNAYPEYVSIPMRKKKNHYTINDKKGLIKLLLCS